MIKISKKNRFEMSFPWLFITCNETDYRLLYGNLLLRISLNFFVQLDCDLRVVGLPFDSRDSTD